MTNPNFFVLIVAACAALVVVLFATPIVRRFALFYKIGDYPGERKIHTRFIPRMGGAAIILGFAGVLLTSILLGSVLSVGGDVFLGIIASLILITLLGIYDDIRGVGSLGKLIVQGIAAGLVIHFGLRITYLSLPFVGSVDLGFLSIPVTVLWLVGVTNAVNLLDGLDGLAAGVSVIVATSFFLIGFYLNDRFLMVASVGIVFSCLGFLRYNFHPASIFMGDTGSLFLGFLLACLGLYILRHPGPEGMSLSLLVPIVALAVPIVDTSVAFFRRLKRGMHPLRPDKEHIHHRLMDLGLTHRQTVVVNYAVSAVYALIAFLLVFLDALYGLVLTLFVFGSAFVAIRRLGYLEEMSLRKGTSSTVIQPLSIARIIDRSVLVMGDLVAIMAAFLLSYWFRFSSGLFEHSGFVPLETYVVSPAMLILAGFWLLMFLVAGLYEIPWDMSRIDYAFLIVKTAAAGTLILFLLTFDFSDVSFQGRLTTLVYGSNVLLLVVLTRMLIVGIERRYEILGFRRRGTVIIGTTEAAEDLVREIHARPGLKYDLVGFVDRRRTEGEFLGFPILGDLENLPSIVKEKRVEEILVATGYESREEILDILARCNGMVPNVKVVPESTDMLSGFKTEEIIGHPLIRIYPTNLRAWQRFAKRLIDIAVSLIVLIPFLPLWLIVGLLIKSTSPGPIFFVQERVGRKGRLFRLLKFRSMVHEAEKETGPVWATLDDKRITALGRWLRKLRIDEIPQLVNVLKGEMSLVGPRPERQFFVGQLQHEVRFYTRRLLVRPGITGWAQVRHRYDRSLEDVKEKIRYDLYYLENMSLMLDFKIILRTILVALSGKGTH